jgi:hypothetical protein
MKIFNSLESESAYFRKLVGAGLNAASTARTPTTNQPLKPELAHAARTAWVPAVIGTAVGVLAVCLARKNRSVRDALVGGLVGGALGFGGGVAWASREVASSVVRQAARNVGVVRDEHWLERNPVAYG